MKTTFLLIVLAFTCIATACDSDAANDDNNNLSGDAGTGTGNLWVDAHIEGKSGDSTEMHVSVELGSLQVSGAAVEIESELGVVTLQENGIGYYEGYQSGFAAEYKLYVKKGDDFLEVSLSSPEPHEITAPQNGFNYDTTSGDLSVIWSPTGADETRVRSDKSDVTINGDPGSATISSSYFEKDDDEISVRRINTITVAEGAPDSHLDISFEVEHEINVLNPVD